ncbi:hypothetical protein LG299_14605 [Microbacterium lacus]|uniref:hypothetical protein n=1 Tax=Microbacterium lacus TaxID=415217 RepID=UPI003851645A
MTYDDTVLLEPPAEASAPDPSSIPEPRVRWAGVAWGLVFAALAGVGLWVVTTASVREAIRTWILEFDPDTVAPGAIVAAAIIVVGLVLLIVGAVALVRRKDPRVVFES